MFKLVDLGAKKCKNKATKKDLKMHLRESRTSKFSGGACPRTPLGSKALGAFGKYTCLLLLSTHFCKNLLKPLKDDSYYTAKP